MEATRETKLTSAAMQRMLTLVALLVESPGLEFGGLKEALEQETGRTWGTSTLHKDIKALKQLRILADVAQREGYFLTDTLFAPEDWRSVLNALRSQGINLRNPIARKLYLRLMERLTRMGHDPDVTAYPLEAIGNRVVPDTLDEDFTDLMENLREAMRVGKQVIVRKVRDPWKTVGNATFTLHPLQFIFHNVAWYLLAEDCADGWFRILRLDRLSPAVSYVDAPARGIKAQMRRLTEAKEALHQGWGMAMPTQREIQAPLSDDWLDVEVWFDSHAARFMEENERRHRTQQIELLSDGSLTFRFHLPRSVLKEFSFWVMGWGPSAVLRCPAFLREQLEQDLIKALDRYQAN